VQSPAPPRLIEGGIPTEALVAQVAVARYADHQPLYRQAQMMARQGVMLDRSTLAFWMGYAAAEVAPVVARLREMVLASARVFADETVVPVLDPGRGSLSGILCEGLFLSLTLRRNGRRTRLRTAFWQHSILAVPSSNSG